MDFEYEVENMSVENIGAEEFERKFDEGESVVPYADFSKAERPNRKLRKVNLDLPVWMIQSLDRQAKYLGISRQALMKVWLAEKIAAIPGN